MTPVPGGGPGARALRLVPLGIPGALAAVALRRGRGAESLALLAVASLLAGAAWASMRVETTEPVRVTRSGQATGTVEVDAPPSTGGSGIRARVTTRFLSGPGAIPAGRRLLLDLPPGARTPAVGMVIRIGGQVGPASRPGAPAWWDAWLRREGIAGRMRATSWTEEGSRGGLVGARDALRRWATANVASGLSGDRAALVRGMALGGGEGLSEDAGERMRDAGLWHLLAVSGQNVAVVGIGVGAVLAALGRGRRARLLWSGAAMAAYCLACDGGASVARAGLMGAVGLMADLRGGHRARWHALTLALVVLLALDPLAIGDPGLQLSFAAVAGLFAITPPVAVWLRGWIPARAADLVAQSAGAGLATAPVLASGFGSVSVVGLLANLVAVPVAGPVVVIALAGTVANAAWQPIGRLLAVLAATGAGAIMAVATVASAIPGAVQPVPGWAAVPLLGVAATAPILWWWLRRVPGCPRARRLPSARGPVVIASASLVAVLVVPRLLGSGAPGTPPGAGIRMIDVGQGSSVVLRSGARAEVMIDAGPSGEPAAAVGGLKRMGARGVGVLVITHGAADHAGGAADVLDHVPVGRLLLPGADRTAPLVRDLERRARARAVPVEWAAAGIEVAAGAWSARVIGPARAARPGTDPNESSLVVLARSGGLTALLPADAEGDVLRRLVIPPVDVLQVSHHGSEDPGLPDVLARITPTAALVSSGQGNAFGHPRDATLRALERAGARVLRTDSGGDIDVRAEGDGIVVAQG